MDLEIFEALALSEDRTAALAQLLPGSEDHDYYRCLHAQHANRLDEADTILGAWPERHGSTSRYDRLRMRQQLYRLGTDPGRVADEIRDRFGVQHWHQAEAPEVDPDRATRLAPGTFDADTLLQQAIDYDANLSQLTDEGLYELLGRPLDAARRRMLLQRLSHTPDPAVVDLIADELDTRGSAGFGTLAIHNLLTLDQLGALAQRRPELRTHSAWIAAVVRRMQPPDAVDLELDRAAREAYLVELWRFVRALPPASNTLKAHVLWHLLDAHRRRDTFDPELFLAYLQLPRTAGYLPRTMVDRAHRDDVAELGRDLRDVTGLGPAGDDEELVRDLLHRTIAAGGATQAFAQWLDRHWLDAEVATAQLLHGVGASDRATLALGPARAQALKERVELQWCRHAPLRFGLDEPIALDVDVKNVPELVVKVFRIDPLAYFQHHHREVSSDLDLDGLAASHELVLRFAEPAIRRVRRRIELPMCARAGTYVIDLIGNGMSSRAVVHKGRLRHVTRIGAAGHVVTIVDEAGRPRPDARAWIGDREYLPDERGGFVVPFSTNPQQVPMLLACGDIATVATLELRRETYRLTARLMLDRESLTTGRTARAIVRVGLAVAGAEASLAIVKRARWDVTLTDRAGVSTTKSQPLALADDEACVLDIPLGDDPAHVSIAIRGAVDVIAEQREEELAETVACEIASMHRGDAIEALYLAPTGGWVLSALGKTGEPRARRPVNVGLVHRWTNMQQNVALATDERGRVELGELPGIARIAATLGALTQTWNLERQQPATTIQIAAGKDALVAIPPDRAAGEVIRRASLVEIRRGAVVRHAGAELEPLADAIAIRGLPAGHYRFRAPGVAETAIVVAPATTEVGGAIVAPTEVVELTRPAPVLAEITGALRIRVRGATSRTRIHVIGTRFAPAPVARLASASRRPEHRTDRARAAVYMSGRDIGDEYRYILDRRGARRFPSLLLDKPSLLLNPWARRTTTTDVAHAAGGGSFAAPSPSMAMSRGPGGAPRPGPAPDDDAFVGYDFIPEPPAVLANLVPDADGVVAIPAAELGRATCATVICDDPQSLSWRVVPLAETPLAPRDLRLALALEPTRHATETKAIAPLPAGGTIVIDDLATAKVHLVDSVERAYSYLLALRDDATLREFGFVARWHALGEPERRELYSKYACHELHLFLYFKDRPWFDAVVKPYLAHKRTKTFVDHWLLGADLVPYLEPFRLERLNAFERALLAQRIDAGDALGRLLADEVAVQPPDPARDTRLIDALLGASTLHGNEELLAAKLFAERFGDATNADMPAFDMLETERAAPTEIAAAAKPRKAAKKQRNRAADTGEDTDDEVDRDVDRRRAAAPMYRAGDKTQEWAENNWWHRTPAESGADMIAPSRLWRDLANHRGGLFLSPGLGLATGSFAETLAALAVTDLPFAAGGHAIVSVPPRLTITAATPALAGSSQLVDGELVATGSPVIVGTSYVRTDDAYDWVDGEQVDKTVDAFAPGVVYTCRVVLANPTGSRQRVAGLIQIPRGSMPTRGGRPTQTIDVVLEAFETHGHEYGFYFPATGSWTHFGVHVARAGAIIAAAPGRTLAVTAGGAALDPRSWPQLSQRGSLADVVEFLATANLAAIDVETAAWRLRDRPAYDAILGALERRRAYSAELWGYALYHHDLPRIRVWLRARGADLLAAGPALDMPTVELDAEALDAYEHLELSPLVNARAHRLGAKLRILNDGLAAQYARFLDLVSHRRAVTAEDRLAAAAYFLAQDRVDAALAELARVSPGAVADRMQHDYLAAYAACLAGELPRARALATPWRELPVDRWRRRFEALVAMLDEVAGAAPAVVDPKSRDQQHGELAAKQPTFDIAVDRDGVVIRHQHVAALELRYFEMDVELLFSRQPFVQSDVSRFSFIEPGHREQLAAPPTEHRVAWPAALRGKNVVVEAVGAGLRKARVHYANDLATNLAHQYGQVRVQRASDQAALAATYVKVYARKHGGAVEFYKDGYTDLRGWFDYATLSTTDLDAVDRFAILVCSDHAGAAILEAGVPAR